MEDLHRQGLVRAIGVSNFTSGRLVDLIEHNQVTPAVNQIETHPFHQRLAEHEVMRARGVQHESWGPFAEGKNNLFTDPVLTEIGTAHGKTVAQVVLRWLTQLGVVAIPKSVRRDRMEQNFDIFDFTLSDEQMSRIAGLDTGAGLFIDHEDPATISQMSKVRFRD
jgi:2,5-diketo-D-gluconate reductase A